MVMTSVNPTVFVTMPDRNIVIEDGDPVRINKLIRESNDSGNQQEINLLVERFHLSKYKYLPPAH